MDLNNRLMIFPNSISSNKLLIMMEELGIVCDNQETLDIFNWENLSLNHLRLSSKGSVPLLVKSSGQPLEGAEIFDFLHDVAASSRSSNSVCVYPSNEEARSRAIKFQRKLDDINIGIITYGLAFHIHKTAVLRYPYHDEQFYEKSSHYILSRAEKLSDAAELTRAENSEISTELRNLADMHQDNLPHYLEEEGYDSVLKSLEKVLDYFEDELGRDDRIGVWLGGAQFCLADVTLGLYLHRLYQLGLDAQYFQEGVRPQLSVFYQSILKRTSFQKVLQLKENGSKERRILSDADKSIENAKWGLGIAALIGGLFMARKIIKK